MEAGGHCRVRKSAYWKLVMSPPCLLTEQLLVFSDVSVDRMPGRNLLLPALCYAGAILFINWYVNETLGN